MTAPGAARLGHRPALDGLRGLAVALVVAHHTGVLVLGGTPVLPGGFLGVDVFLVLSGYLITTLLLERRDEPRALVVFYVRRALRLGPAVVWLLLVVGGLALLTGTSPGLVAQTTAAALTWTVNYVALAGVDLDPRLTHLWSLAIEEQFYVVWPLVVLGALRLGGGARVLLGVCVLAVVAVVAWRAHLLATGEGWLRIYLRTDARADGLAVGAALALLPQARLRARASPALRAAGAGALGLVVAAAVVLEPSSAVLYAGGFTVVALLVAVAVAAVLPGEGLVARGLALAPARALGRVSYSLYLWHFPVFTVAGTQLAGVPAAPRVALAWLVALALAVVSLRLVERPALRLRRRLPAPPPAQASPPDGAGRANGRDDGRGGSGRARAAS